MGLFMWKLGIVCLSGNKNMLIKFVWMKKCDTFATDNSETKQRKLKNITRNKRGG